MRKVDKVVLLCLVYLLSVYAVLGALKADSYVDYPITSITPYESDKPLKEAQTGYQKWVVVEFNGQKHKACLNGAEKSNAGYDYARQYSSGLYVLYLTAETKRCLGKPNNLDKEGAKNNVYRCRGSKK